MFLTTRTETSQTEACVAHHLSFSEVLHLLTTVEEVAEYNLHKLSVCGQPVAEI